MLNEIPQPLLQPRRLGDLWLPNRVVMAPLTRGRANNSGHVPNDLMREYYEQRATAGLIISEGTWVSEDGQGWLGAPGIYNREQGAGWKAITDAVHGKGGRIFAQLWHQGAVSHPSFFHNGRLPLAPSAIDLSHVFLMRQLADLSGTPIAALAGDAVIHHLRKIYHGQLILNVGISHERATELVEAGLGDFVAFGREYIANPDLVERIRLNAPLNEQRSEGYYGATAFGYTDYPFLTVKDLPAETEGASLSLRSGLE
jgi:2,4-dienoyl-CoA reductase-like NADH-dependent reductase (Old Yellow Enzyme family)